MNLATLPWVPCQNRDPRGGPVDLLVLHTNEGPEGPTSAEGLAAYLQHAPSGAGYNVTGDENSAVRCAQDSETVWGAGGVNSRAWHYCVTGWSAQSAAQWDDASSRAALVLAASLLREAAQLLGVPMVRITDPRPGNRGICGHDDVSRYYPASGGHTDPGDGFPWDRFVAMVANPGPTPEQIAAYFRLLEEQNVEHGQAVDAVIKPGTGVPGVPPVGYKLERWGGLIPFGGAVPVRATGYWKGLDAARRIVVTDWAKGYGYVMDGAGALHPFGPSLKDLPPATATPGYWPAFKLVPFSEV